MQVISHLNFNGNCNAAFHFYAATLGGKITTLMTQGESPMSDQVPTEMKDKIMHATLEFPGGAALMGADHPQAERIFKGLAEGGTVQMAFQRTFWSPGFGMCTDKFDIPWMVNCVARS
jgi:PhnB protein